MKKETPQVVYRKLIEGIPKISKWPNLLKDAVKGAASEYGVDPTEVTASNLLTFITETTASFLSENLDPDYQVSYNYTDIEGGTVNVEGEKGELELRIGVSAVGGTHTIIGPSRGKLKFEYDSASEFEELPVIKIKSMTFKEKVVGVGIRNMLEIITNTYKLPLYWEVEQYKQGDICKSTLYMRQAPEWNLVKFEGWDI